jgi:glutamine amidotransferase
MCELLGMSANVPTDICFSFSGLVQRGGKTGPHRDGWGIAFYEGKGCRLFHDPLSSVDSEIARFIKRYSIKSKIVVSHVRKANRGKVSLANTHPFTRELWGSSWVFAHNGQLKGIKKNPLKYYIPIGTTDSEHAFCWMLDKIRAKFPERPKKDKELSEYINNLANKLAKLGAFNFLLSDSRRLYAHCSTKMCWITRRAPFGKARLIDEDMTVDFKQVTTPNDIVTVIATQPLTNNEEWNIMPRNSFEIFHNGLPQK